MRSTELAALATLAIALAASSACAPRSSSLLSPELAADCEGVAALERPLVIANYNIKSGVWSSLEEVASVIEGLDADVIALQEVDNGMGRTGGVDQSAVLAERIGAERVFAGAVDRDGGSYGIALLSRVPFVSVGRLDLPDANGAEPRVVIDAEVCAGPSPLRVLGSHFDFLPWASEQHAAALKEHVGDDDDVVLMGDFNIPPEHHGVRALVDRPLRDALALFDEGPTFADNRIDYILTDQDVVDAEIVESAASDHHAVKAAIR